MFLIRILLSFFSLEVRHAPLKFHEDVQWNRRMKNRETRGTRVGDGASAAQSTSPDHFPDWRRK